MGSLVTARDPQITLTLPEPPSANTYWRHVGAKVLLSATARQYRQDVQAVVLGLPLEQRRHLPVAGALAVTLHWYRGRRAGDLDNRTKQPLDALTHAGVWTDDSQLVELHQYRHDAPGQARLEVVITTMGEGR